MSDTFKVSDTLHSKQKQSKMLLRLGLLFLYCCICSSTLRVSSSVLRVSSSVLRVSSSILRVSSSVLRVSSSVLRVSSRILYVSSSILRDCLSSLYVCSSISSHKHETDTRCAFKLPTQDSIASIFRWRKK